MEVVLFTKQIGCLIFLSPMQVRQCFYTCLSVSLFTLREGGLPKGSAYGGGDLHRWDLHWGGLPTGRSALGDLHQWGKGLLTWVICLKRGLHRGGVFLQWVCLQEGSAFMG